MSSSSKAFLHRADRLKDLDTCSCDKKPNRVARGGCPDDLDAVAVLPDNWKPKHSGPILSNYLKQRKQDHQKVLDDIAKSAAAVNEDINDRVRTLSENLLAHIQQNQRDIDCLIDNCDKGVVPLTAASRDTVFKKIREMMTERVAFTKDFKQETYGLERERADKLRILLRGQFQRLITIGHKTPKDLMHEFDDKIYDINQQLLSNSKAYTELEADLRRLSDEGMTRALTSLNQLCLGVGMMVRGRSALIWCKDQKVSRKRSQSAMIGPSINPGNILDHVRELDAIISPLVEAYRNAVMKIFYGFSSKLTELEKDLGGPHDFSGPNELPKFELFDLHVLLERQFYRITNSFNKKLGQSSNLEASDPNIILIQKSLCSLGECLRETCSILNHAGHLWDAHILRSALAQKLTITAVEDLLTSHDSIEQANEVSFNIALEQMRCAPDADKLQSQFDAILVLLDKTGLMYVQHSEAELRRLEEFMNFHSVLANTLLAEFNVFLERYPRTSVNASVSTTSLPVMGNDRRNSCSQISVQMPLPRAIFQTELQELALMNWRNGFLESFKSNVSLLPEELKHQARLWVEERSAALHMRYSLKVVSHTIRSERVKAAREARLAELQCHDVRLESHLAAITELVERLPEETYEFAGVDAPMLYPYYSEVERMKINIDNAINPDLVDPEVKKMKMKSYAPRLAKHRQLFEESLDAAMIEYKWLIEHRIQEARIANVRYMTQLKLFSEDGQYAALEATKTCVALGKAAETLEMCVTKTLDILAQRRTQLLALADHQMLPLQRIIDDCIKPGGKSPAKTAKSATKLQDKKKKK